MKKLIIIILLLFFTMPILNQNNEQNTDKNKSVFGDVFDRRDEDENYIDFDGVKMYKEENKLEPLNKKEKIVWAFRTAERNPFI